MGKSGRHKKLNRQEKAKTNLKGVKKLAKAANVVEPSLKVKRIVIREQLASTFGGGGSSGGGGNLLSKSSTGLSVIIGGKEIPTTSRKQTLGDILSSLRHHNTSIRREALGGLAELIQGSSSSSSPGILLQNNLDKILERILFLLQDLESSVRVENLKCAKALFERLSSGDHLNAYWGLVLSHIRAAITHLNSKVRTHSLSFIRLLAIHFPKQVKASASAILPPVLSLLVGGGGAEGGGGGPEVLKASGVKERLAVFSLVESILSLEDQEQDDKEEDRSNNSIVVFSGQDKRKCPAGLVYPMGYYCGSGGSNNTKSLWEDGRKDDDKTWWGHFVMQAFKLVTATWVEVKDGGGARSKKRIQDDGTEDCEMIDLDEQPGALLKKKPVKMTMVNATEVEVLDSLVGVLFSIIQRIKTMTAGSFANDCIESLRKTEGPDVKKYFVALLPFEASNSQISSKLVMKLNLRLFSVASQLRLIDNKVRGILAKYLINIADMGLDSDHINLSLRILQEFRMGSVDKRDVCTSFLCSVLDVDDDEDWTKLCVKLDEFLRLSRSNNEEEQEQRDSFIHSVDWNKVVTVLGSREKVTKELLRVFTYLKLRNLGITSLSEVVEALLVKGCFKPFMEQNATKDEDRKALQRFLWYMELKDKLEEHHLSSVMCGVEL